jgi:hypothetical protein
LADGVAVCTAPDEGLHAPAIITDGDYGAIIAWSDDRSGAYHVYAQRLDAAGNPLWLTDGNLVSGSAYNKYDVAMAPDGAGGAVIAWHDHPTDSRYRIYAQRIDALGNP